MTTGRFEVVYKNLIRSIKKPFRSDFRQYITPTRESELKTHAMKLLTEWAASRFGFELAALPVLKSEEIAVSLGSFMIPKILKRCKLSDSQKDRVLEVEKYRKDNFSQWKLEDILADLPMMVVFCK